jgi:hypothetical protein
MPSLKKPSSCACGGIGMDHLFKPERWVCQLCSTILVERPQLNPKGVCRECKTTDNMVDGKNICRICRNSYMKKYTEKNYDRMRSVHLASYQRNKEKRRGAVYECIQRSYESLLSDRISHMRAPSHRRSGSGQRSIVDIDTAYAMEVLKAQDYKCALTGIPLTHRFKEMTCVSVDRIDSTQGYVRGNIQLVCSSVNFMKRSWTQDQAIDFIRQIRLGGR